jgi:hypothetical protein
MATFPNECFIVVKISPLRHFHSDFQGPRPVSCGCLEAVQPTSSKILAGLRPCMEGLALDFQFQAFI